MKTSVGRVSARPRGVLGLDGSPVTDGHLTAPRKLQSRPAESDKPSGVQRSRDLGPSASAGTQDPAVGHRLMDGRGAVESSRSGI